MSKTILTGLRSNSDLHLGNYLGAIKPMVDIQSNLGTDDKLFMFVPDLHSFTTPIEHSSFYSQTIDNVRAFISAGIDPKNSQTLLYRQSRIPAHSELAWILSNFTYFGEASRMTEFKDKTASLNDKTISVGLFNYPILMSADIFLYSAEFVPVGDDQKQHMELARTLAQRFNKKFGEIITVPKNWKQQLEFTGRSQSPRIRSLTNPKKKMSKSIDDPRGTISLFDDPVEAVKKVMSATTDSLGKVGFDFEKQSGISNLLQILAILEGEDLEKTASAWQDQTSYGDLKKATADAVSKFLTEFQESFKAVDPQSVEAILEAGEQQARPIAEAKLAEIQKAIGLKK